MSCQLEMVSLVAKGSRRIEKLEMAILLLSMYFLLLIIIMFKLSTWNIRGLNKGPKQLAVRNFVSAAKLDLLCIVETKVKKDNWHGISRAVFLNWEAMNNYFDTDSGRIWIGWNPDILRVIFLTESDQLCHCDIFSLDLKMNFFASFIYTSNDDVRRQSL